MVPLSAAHHHGVPTFVSDVPQGLDVRLDQQPRTATVIRRAPSPTPSPNDSSISATIRSIRRALSTGASFPTKAGPPPGSLSCPSHTPFYHSSVTVRIQRPPGGPTSRPPATSRIHAETQEARRPHHASVRGVVPRASSISPSLKENRQLRRPQNASSGPSPHSLRLLDTPEKP